MSSILAGQNRVFCAIPSPQRRSSPRLTAVVDDDVQVRVEPARSEHGDRCLPGVFSCAASWDAG